ncbi:MAG: hypothetical protein ACI8QS_002911 [Planctomycetota bacterium]|jgi:hypothetical protein
MGQRYLLRLLRKCVEYYNESDLHQSLERDAPLHRSVERAGYFFAKPALTGHHHLYFRTG